MTVHAIRVETAKISRGTPPETILRQFRGGTPTATGREEWEVPPRLISSPYEDSNAEFWTMRIAVPEDRPIKPVLDSLETRLRSMGKWFRIRYLLFDPDEENRGPFEIYAEHGEIPDGVP